MNTTATEIQTPAAAAVRTPRHRTGRLIRALAVLAAVLGLAGTTTITGASTASAAAYAQVTVCFESAYHYSVYGTPWTRYAKYILYNPSTARWQTQTTYASPTGCIKFSVYPGYNTYFEVYENWGSYYYSAQTRVYTFAAGYTYNLGWYKVTKTLTF